MLRRFLDNRPMLPSLREESPPVSPGNSTVASPPASPTMRSSRGSFVNASASTVMTACDSSVECSIQDAASIGKGEAADGVLDSPEAPYSSCLSPSESKKVVDDNKTPGVVVAISASDVAPPASTTEISTSQTQSVSNAPHNDTNAFESSNVQKISHQIDSTVNQDDKDSHSSRLVLQEVSCQTDAVAVNPSEEVYCQTTETGTSDLNEDNDVAIQELQSKLLLLQSSHDDLERDLRFHTIKNEELAELLKNQTSDVWNERKATQHSRLLVQVSELRAHNQAQSETISILGDEQTDADGLLEKFSEVVKTLQGIQVEYEHSSTENDPLSNITRKIRAIEEDRQSAHAKLQDAQKELESKHSKILALEELFRTINEERALEASDAESIAASKENEKAAHSENKPVQNDHKQVQKRGGILKERHPNRIHDDIEEVKPDSVRKKFLKERHPNKIDDDELTKAALDPPSTPKSASEEGGTETIASKDDDNDIRYLFLHATSPSSSVSGMTTNSSYSQDSSIEETNHVRNFVEESYHRRSVSAHRRKPRSFDNSRPRSFDNSRGHFAESSRHRRSVSEHRRAGFEIDRRSEHRRSVSAHPRPDNFVKASHHRRSVSEHPRTSLENSRRSVSEHPQTSLENSRRSVSAHPPPADDFEDARRSVSAHPRTSFDRSASAHPHRSVSFDRRSVSAHPRPSLPRRQNANQGKLRKQIGQLQNKLRNAELKTEQREKYLKDVIAEYKELEKRCAKATKQLRVYHNLTGRYGKKKNKNNLKHDSKKRHDYDDDQPIVVDVFDNPHSYDSDTKGHSTQSSTSVTSSSSHDDGVVVVMNKTFDTMDQCSVVSLDSSVEEDFQDMEEEQLNVSAMPNERLQWDYDNAMLATEVAVAKYEKIVSEYSQLQDELDDAKGDCGDLKEELERVKAELEQAITERQSKENDMEFVLKEHEQMETEHSGLQAKAASLETDLEAAKEQIQNLANIKTQREADLRMVIGKYKELQEQHDMVQHKATLYEQELDASRQESRRRDVVHEYRMLEHEHEEAIAQIVELEVAVSNARKELVCSKEESRCTRKRLTQCHAQLQKLQAQHEKLQNKFAAIDTELKRVRVPSSNYNHDDAMVEKVAWICKTRNDYLIDNDRLNREMDEMKLFCEELMIITDMNETKPRPATSVSASIPASTTNLRRRLATVDEEQ